MELVTGATTRLLPKLGALLKDEYKLQDKVKKDIESLQNELVFMNATLRMVAEVPRDQLDEHVRIWAVFIKDVSYDMEDVVNTFVMHVHGAPHREGLIRKAFNVLCMGRTNHEIARMVEEIRSLIKEVADLRERYRFDNIVTRAATPVVLLPRENTLTRSLAADCEEITHRHIGIKYEEPVGVEEDMKVLHDWITSGDNHSMLSILGPAGVGKTTIATALYHNYADQFQSRAMVNVSSNSGNFELALMNILKQVKPQEVTDHDGSIPEIATALQDCLQGKRFLILLGDVWSASMLENFRNIFLKVRKAVE
ncbi:hypothetical protein CFC21_090251 [Triticum aestivum]|uniref:AAA+ ATPase domain-containing protein n=2 Tax=Triticum aestivum TaxID=4565 RepID=A0A9R1MRT0_WHEAT|nr:hypothetical protein CFC21_090251 [Triticum aestivum]